MARAEVRHLASLIEEQSMGTQIGLVTDNLPGTGFMVFRQGDTSTLSISPFRLGEKSQDPLAMYLSDIFTIPSDLSGTPAISIPCGLAPDGLPVGFQFMGKLTDESTVLRAAHALEQDLGFSARPALLAELEV